MPLVEVLALDVGSSIAKAILKRWLGDSGPIADSTSSIMDVLRLTQKRTERHFGVIGEKIGESLLPLFQKERIDCGNVGGTYDIFWSHL